MVDVCTVCSLMFLKLLEFFQNICNATNIGLVYRTTHPNLFVFMEKLKEIIIETFNIQLNSIII